MPTSPSGEQDRVAARRITRIQHGSANVDCDSLTTEEPLEIRIGNDPIAVIMRTPQDDFELTAGFLYTERLIQHSSELMGISYCKSARPPNQRNVVEARLADEVDFDPAKLQRNFFVSSSCGVCGKASIEALLQHSPPLEAEFKIDTATICGLDEKLLAAQSVFEQTGSLHAAALFDREGEVLVIREDVGRHNAVDKVVGSFIVRRQQIPEISILMVSGRASFEIIQKAHMAGIPFVAAVSAPSSLAVDLANEAGITLVGFLRNQQFNVYAGDHRIA